MERINDWGVCVNGPIEKIVAQGRVHLVSGCGVNFSHLSCELGDPV